MLIRLLFVVAEVCRSPRTLLLLGAHACQVVVTSTVIAVMCSLVETASRLGGEHAAVLRSFSTPGSVAAALCAMIVTGSASSAVHDALRSVRTPWRAAGVSPVLASVAIAAQVTVVNAASILTGLLLARAAVAATTNVSIVDAATSLRLGARRSSEPSSSSARRSYRVPRTLSADRTRLGSRIAGSLRRCSSRSAGHCGSASRPGWQQYRP